MLIKKFLFIITVILSASTTIGLFLPSTNLWAASIVCNLINPCIGTNSSDDMQGDDKNNDISGKGGDDSISGLAGKDVICGGSGDDKIAGGAGDDLIYSGKEIFATDPDGHKDTIDCGPGDDTALINVRVDHDVAINCEHFTV